MHFLLKIYKKKSIATEKRLVTDLKPVREVTAPSADASTLHYHHSHQLALIVYLYDLPYRENIEDFFKIKDGVVHFRAGFCSGAIEDTDPSRGDGFYLRIEHSGSGVIKRPKMSFFQIFYCQTADCVTIASEPSLVLLSHPEFRTQCFRRLFDNRFIYEAITREWAPRKEADRTYARSVKRLLPHYEVSFKRNRLAIRKLKYEVAVMRPDLEKMYLASKDLFYEHILSQVLDYTYDLLRPLKGCVIRINLTGGLDSRNSLALLAHFRARLEFRIQAFVSGPRDHPDVVVAKQLAALLEVDLLHCEPDGQDLKANISRFPSSLSDYQKCFRVSQGDKNSNNYSIVAEVARVPTVFGTDNFKRADFGSAVSLNRYFARSIAGRTQYLLLSVDIVCEAAYIIAKHCQDPAGTEFSYMLLKRFAPEMLRIPYAGQVLPQHPVPPVGTVEQSKVMPNMVADAYLDYSFLVENLSIFKDVSRCRATLRRISPRTEQRLRFLLHSYRFAPRFYRSIGPRNGLNDGDKRKLRIAMDYASVSNLTPMQLFKSAEYRSIEA